MKVFVYYNLHKHKWSVQNWKTKKVITHVDKISLKDCTFKVSEAGRQRVLREKRKNVHAGVLGEWVDAVRLPNKKQITYNPYKHSSFVDVEKYKPIYKASRVRLNNKKVFAEE